MQLAPSLYFNQQVAIHEKLQPFKYSTRAVNRDNNRK